MVGNQIPNVVGVIVLAKRLFYIHLVLGCIHLSVCESNGNVWRLDIKATMYLMFIGPCIIVLVEEWKTNLMSLATLFHFLCAQHVSDINVSIIRSLRLCCWITTSVVLFCKDGWFSVSVNLRFIVVCVWSDVFCRFVVVGRRILIDIVRNRLSA